MATATTISGSQFDALPYEEGRRWELLEGDLIQSPSLRPDLCVLRKEKAMQLNPDRVPVPGAPDIAIEVISPTERAIESHDTIQASTQNIVSSLLPDLNLCVASLFEQEKR